MTVMTISDKVKALNNVETCINEYATYFIDWELMYNDKSYKPEFPEHLIIAFNDLKLLAEELDKAAAKET